MANVRYRCKAECHSSEGSAADCSVVLFFYWRNAACSFSLLVQRKQNQMKTHPTIFPLRGFPALLAFIGAKINSLRSTRF